MLGPFEVTELIGEGGMGKVWKGHHHLNGKPVALKVLLGRFTSQRKYLEGFHREVRATARLDHPGIVQVFDYGVVSSAAAQHHPEFEEGSPWLAMEYAPGSSLEKMPEAMSWAQLKHLILQILDALAHSHARQLVHRDLKPANVLRRPQSNTEGLDDWMLSDFGIAHVRDPKVSGSTGDIQALTAGTPLFMAPEQLNGDWRDYGPWTDLYALGCMAYLLASGTPPFTGDSVIAIAMKHMSDPAPPLKPMMALPPGFENWIRRLLVKDIGTRCRHAADAATDLLLLGDPEGEVQHSTQSPGFDIAETPTLGATLLSAPDSLSPPTELLDHGNLRDTLESDRFYAPSDISSPLARAKRVISPPASWKRPTLEEGFRTIPSAGKGIFGLRQIPVVGRIAERDHLWNEFRNVCANGRPRCVVIRGTVGMGKTRLMDWLSLRADELGVATTLRATHSPIMNATEGLPRMFQSHLTATDLGRPALLRRLTEAYRTHFGEVAPDELELAALVEWMNPLTDEMPPDDIPRVQLESPLERHTLARTLLQRIALERPIILGIEDGHWGQDSLALARHLLANNDHNFPLLIVVTVRHDALSGRLAEREYLQLVTEEDNSSVLELEPLTTDEQRRLISLMLGLDNALIDRISNHSDGTPLFGVQLIEDWVSRDILQEGKSGYLLPEDEEFPADIHELMERRTDEIASEWHDEAQIRMAMEMAAALGIDVDRSEWERLGKLLGCELSTELEDHLMLHGLAVPRSNSNGWRFRLPLYRDSLEAISQREGRWKKINAACAEIIAYSTENGTCLAERRARYLLAAEQPDEAIPQLWRAIKSRTENSAYIQAIALVSMLGETFDHLGYSDLHEERARLHVHHAEVLRFRGNVDTCRELLDQVLNWQTTLSDSILADAHRVLANTENFVGNPTLALTHYQKALSIFETLDDGRGIARSLHGIGWLRIILGDLDAAAVAFQQGFEIAMESDELLAAAWCMQGVTEMTMHTGDPEAETHARRAQELFNANGCRSGLSVIHRSLGDMSRRQGDFPRARSHYEKARYFAESSGHVLASVADALFAFCDVSEGNTDDALRRFRHLDTVTREKIFPLYLPVVPLGNLFVAAHDNNHKKFDELLQYLTENLPPVTPIAQDILLLLEHSAIACEERGDRPRAEAARTLANRYRSKRSATD